LYLINKWHDHDVNVSSSLNMSAHTWAGTTVWDEWCYRCTLFHIPVNTKLLAQPAPWPHADLYDRHIDGGVFWFFFLLQLMTYRINFFPPPHNRNVYRLKYNHESSSSNLELLNWLRSTRDGWGDLCRVALRIINYGDNIPFLVFLLNWMLSLFEVSKLWICHVGSGLWVGTRAPKLSVHLRLKHIHLV
jgi:hypothetical protein